MFGMEKEKINFAFDLEKELKGPNGAKKLGELKDHIANQIEVLKKALRHGENKEEFDKAEVLLHGYMAYQQIVGRIKI